MGIHQALTAGGLSGSPLMTVLTSLSLTTNLELCLDAADSASYTSGQKWLDRSGLGYDFFLGADGTATSTDPTFVGGVGAPSSYWSFDGGDYFTYDSANETWMQNLHKNNAIFTIISFYYTDISMLMTVNSPATSGVALRANRLTIVGGGLDVLAKTADTSPNLTAWNMSGISLNEATGAGGGFFYLNGAYNQVSGANTFTSTYTAPSTGPADGTAHINSYSDGSVPISAGSRLACIAIWEGTALTKANMDSIWTAMRGRFGI